MLPPLGLGIDKRASFGGAIFSLSNSLHEWNIENASVVGTSMTIPDTGSIGGLALTNPTASQLPSFSTIGGKQSIIGDAIDDVVSNTTGGFRNSDTTGVFHIVFRTPASFGSTEILFSMNDGTTNNRMRISINTSGNVSGLLPAGS